MSDDITGLTIATKRLIKSALTVWVPDPAPVISPVAEVRETSPTYRGDTLVPVAATYSTSPVQTTSVGTGTPDRWVYDDKGNIVYIPRSDSTWGR